ncbi:MAG: histidine kinase [Bacteroidota bacterium]
MKRLLLAFAFWSGIGLLFSTQAYLLSPQPSWPGALLSVMPRWYAWMGLTPLVRWAEHRFLASGSLPRRIAGHLVLGLGVSALVQVFRFGMRTAVGVETLTFQTVLLRGVYWDALIYGMVAGLLIAWRQTKEAEARRLRTARLETDLADAQLRALQDQLRPHFLFNTLNAISAYIEPEPKTARDMMAHLGDLLRLSLTAQQEHTLDAELGALSHYLQIEQLRFADRLHLQLDIEDRTRPAVVPSFLLQPLVENALRHGIHTQRRGGTVCIRSSASEGALQLTVEDDGAGLPAGWSLDTDAGIGLGNTQRRLQRLYGETHRFTVEPAVPKGTRVVVELPFRLSVTPNRA